MSDEKPQDQKEISINLNRESLLWIIGTAAITVASIQFLGMRVISWVLVIAGLLLLGLAVQQVWSRSEEGHPLQRRISELDTYSKLGILGVLLLILGVVAYFSPQDMSVVLAILGLALLIVGALYFVIGSDRTQPAVKESIESEVNPQTAASTEDTTETEGGSEPTDEYRKQSEDFRERVAETLFQHARRASMLTFVVALTFFAVGIGVFLWLAYAAYQSFTAPTGEDTQRLLSLQAYLISQIEASGYQDPLETLLKMLPPLFIEAGRFVPVLGLILIGWIGSRLIVNATRLSQRRVIQETLAELGPLQSTLAGVPPRKPISQVVEQSLSNTRRSFVVRTWLGVVLFSIGIILVIALAIYGFQTGFPDPLTIATIGGAGIVSFIFSMVGSGREATEKAITDITNLELKVARQAQRTEIVDLYVARLMQKDSEPPSTEQIQAILDFLKDDTGDTGQAEPNNQLTNGGDGQADLTQEGQV